MYRGYPPSQSGGGGGMHSLSTPEAPPPPTLRGGDMYNNSGSSNSLMDRYQTGYPSTTYSDYGSSRPYYQGSESSSYSSSQMGRSVYSESMAPGQPGGRSVYPEPVSTSSTAYPNNSSGYRNTYSGYPPQQSQSSSAYPETSRYDSGRSYPPVAPKTPPPPMLSGGNHRPSVSRISEDRLPPPAPRMSADKPVKPKIKLPEKVFACQTTIVFYDRVLKAGIVELKGSGGVTANCFFSGVNVLTTVTDPLSIQLRPGVEMMVHGALQDASHPVPYCASYLWFQDGKNNTMEENYFAPNADALKAYKQKVGEISEILKTESWRRDPARRPLPPPTANMSCTMVKDLPPPLPNLPSSLMKQSSTQAPKSAIEIFNEKRASAQYQQKQAMILAREEKDRLDNERKEEERRRQAEEEKKKQEERRKKALDFSNKFNKRRFTEGPPPIVTSASSMKEKGIAPGGAPTPIPSVRIPPPLEVGSAAIASVVSSSSNIQKTMMMLNREEANLRREVSERSSVRAPSPIQPSVRATRSPTSRRRSRSRSPLSRRRSRSPQRRRRSRSRSRDRRHRSRGRRSRSRGRRSRSRGRRSRSRGRRSRSRGRRSRSRHRRSTSRGRRSGSRSKRKTRTRSRSRNIDSIMRHLDPNIPSFLQHPAERMVGDKSKSVRKQMGENKDTNETESQKIRDESLAILKSIGSTECIVEDEPIIFTLEVEVLYDEEYRQLTQIGAAISEDGKKQVSFFRSIIPKFMPDYNKNLILKNQNNMLSSLGMKYDETLQKYLFTHKKKNEDLEPIQEEKALQDLLGFMKSYIADRKCVVFMHSKDTYIDLFLLKLKMYNLSDEFAKKIDGFCDYTTIMNKLMLTSICKSAKFQDIADVYKQVIGKNWPKDSYCKDGVACLSGNCAKKLMSEVEAYLEKNSLKLQKKSFFDICGYQPFLERSRQAALERQLKSQSCYSDSRDKAVSIELIPSDRPGEVTIVTLKRFECIDVLDVDDVEEMGIEEDSYFSEESHILTLAEDVEINPGFVVTLKADFPLDFNGKDSCGLHAIVYKNPDLDETAEQLVSKFTIERQILPIMKHSLASADDSGLIAVLTYFVQVKVLNPGDTSLALKKGVKIAICKTELKEDPKNPNFVQYSSFKNEIDMKKAKEQDDLIRKQEGIDMSEAKTKKKKRSRNKKKTKQNKTNSEKQKNTGSLSFDLDALDFEPNENEEKEVDDTEENNKEMSDVSLSDLEADILELDNNEDIISDNEMVVESVAPTDREKDKGRTENDKTSEKIVNAPNNIEDLDRVSDVDMDECLVPGATQLENNKQPSPMSDVSLSDQEAVSPSKTNVEKNQVASGEPLPPGEEMLEDFNATTLTVNSNLISIPTSGKSHHQNGQPEKDESAKKGVGKMSDVPVPPMESIQKLTVKQLKAILNFNQLSTSGLKMDLVKRIYKFYTENPDKIDTDFFKQKDLLPETETDSANFPVVKSTHVDLPSDEVENFNTRNVTTHIFSGNNSHNVDGKSQEAEGPSSWTQHNERPNLMIANRTSQNSNEPPPQPTLQTVYHPIGPIEKPRETPKNIVPVAKAVPSTIKAEHDSKVSQKRAEIKALSTLETTFHDRIHFIELQAPIQVEQVGHSIVDFHLQPLDIFISDLSDRKISLKKIEQSDVQIMKQISKITLKGRHVHAEILVHSTEKTIAPRKLFLKVQIERTDIDSEDPFFIPNPHIIDDGVDMFDNSTLIVTVPKDVLLSPKSFHIVNCNVNIKDQDTDNLKSRWTLLTRTTDHGMNIGMRKMILIPRALSQLQIEGGQAKVSVKIYNASRQGLRISTKTNIAKLFLCKEDKFEIQTKGHSTDTVTMQPYETCPVPVRLFDAVRRDSVVVVEPVDLDPDLEVMPGLVRVRTREEKQYVTVSLVNKSNSEKVVRVGREISAFKGLK